MGHPVYSVAPEKTLRPRKWICVPITNLEPREKAHAGKNAPGKEHFACKSSPAPNGVSTGVFRRVPTLKLFMDRSWDSLKSVECFHRGVGAWHTDDSRHISFDTSFTWNSFFPMNWNFKLLLFFYWNVILQKMMATIKKYTLVWHVAYKRVVCRKFPNKFRMVAVNRRQFYSRDVKC